MRRNIGIIHYNTPELTAATVRSVNLHTPGCTFTIFDNSDQRPFPPMEGVTVIDNTAGQIIDFDKLVERYPNRRNTCNNHASSKHIASVDYLFNILPDGFVLMDSDVLVKEDISSFFDPRVAWVGKIEMFPKYDFQAIRLYPFLLWINVPMLREHRIRFWHEGMSYKLSYHRLGMYYDTGGSLLADCRAKHLPERQVDIFKYIEHFRGGSYRKNREALGAQWLEEHKDLWETTLDKPELHYAVLDKELHTR